MNYECRIKDWAYKFFADSNREIEVNKDNLIKCFKGCIRLPKEYMFNDIINMINEMKKEGVKFNCEEY